MSDLLTERLNKILLRVVSNDSSRGLVSVTKSLFISLTILLRMNAADGVGEDWLFRAERRHACGCFAAEPKNRVQSNGARKPRPLKFTDWRLRGPLLGSTPTRPCHIRGYEDSCKQTRQHTTARRVEDRYCSSKLGGRVTTGPSSRRPRSPFLDNFRDTRRFFANDIVVYHSLCWAQSPNPEATQMPLWDHSL
jgi:hypothetical protein